VFNFIIHQGNANQYNLEIPPHPVRMTVTKKTKNQTETTNAGEDMEERNLCTLLVRMYISTTSMEISIKVPQKSKNRATV
jgi:hypothetical protein